MDYVVDDSVAELVQDRVWANYLLGKHPYQNHQTLLPQTHLPDWLAPGGDEEAWYWMVVCGWMQGGVGSTDSTRALAWLYNYLQADGGANPFDPYQAAQMDPEKIIEFLKLAQLGNHRIAANWITNAQLLIEQWNGKVLQIFAGTPSYQQLHQRLSQFAGFKYKMTSMLIYFLIERGIIDYFDYPPPVDFHLQRLAVETEIIWPDFALELPAKALPQYRNARVVAKSDAHYMAMEARLRQVYLSYAIEHGINCNRYADALWLHSQGRCRWNPGNTTHKGKYAAQSTPLKPHLPDWGSDTDLKRFVRSCMDCPVRDLCKYNVPSGPRYSWGILLATPREEPASDPNLLFAYDWSDVDEADPDQA